MRHLALNDVIKKELPNAQVVKICSISQTLRNGDRIEAFGSEELSKAVNEMFFEWTKHSGTSKDPAEEELKKRKKRKK